jgi:hypothetical protein
MAFEQKTWLDAQVLPVLGSDDKLQIHSVLWNGSPPAEVLVFLLAPSSPTWGTHLKRLLDDGWRFDFLREAQVIKADAGLIHVFGGDGAPLFGKNGMVSARLYKKLEDGIGLILQVGHQHESGVDAAQAVKTFFGQFDQNALQVCASFAAPFGQA